MTINIKLKQHPKGKTWLQHLFNHFQTDHTILQNIKCSRSYKTIFSKKKKKKHHYQTSKIGINTNYVQIPAKIILLKNPTNSEFTSNQSIKQKHLTHRDTHTHGKIKDSSFVRTGQLAYLCVRGKSQKTI